MLSDGVSMATNKKDKQPSLPLHVLTANMSPFHLDLSSKGNTFYNHTLFMFLYNILHIGLLVIFTTAIKVRNKRKIILLYFVLVHLAWVSLKFDNLIKITWQQVLLFLLPISIFSASALAFLVIYSSLLKYKYPEAYYIKKYSLIFLIVSFLGICALMSLIFSQVYFNLSLKITSFFSSSILSLVTMYLFIFKQEIVIAFCKHK